MKGSTRRGVTEAWRRHTSTKTKQRMSSPHRIKATSRLESSAHGGNGGGHGAGNGTRRRWRWSRCVGARELRHVSGGIYAGERTQGAVYASETSPQYDSSPTGVCAGVVTHVPSFSAPSPRACVCVRAQTSSFLPHLSPTLAAAEGRLRL